MPLVCSKNRMALAKSALCHVSFLQPCLFFTCPVHKISMYCFFSLRTSHVTGLVRRNITTRLTCLADCENIATLLRSDAACAGDFFSARA
jgi:hypothetical protein